MIPRRRTETANGKAGRERDASSDSTCLPWERSTGPSNGVGVCLSGGGLRAASFSLGVIQALQAERGLMYGSGAARYLSAVSGGSYVAAAHTINAWRLAGDASAVASNTERPRETPAPPLAPGSPEEQHILDHGRYLVTPFLATVGRFALLGLLNFAALAALFIWAGTLLADGAVLVREYLPPHRVLTWVEGQPLPLLVIGLLIAILLAVQGLYSESVIWRNLLPLLALGGIVVLAEPSISGLATTSWFASNAHSALLFGAAVVLLFVTVSAAWMLQRVGVTGVPAAVMNWAQVIAVRVAGGVLLLWSTVVWYQLLLRVFDEGATTSQVAAAGSAFFASLFGGLVFSYVPDRASLHREYRDRIRSCFGIVREGSSIAPVERNLLLSSVGDGSESSACTPQLLICATANVSNVGPSGARRAYAPFVFSYDVCGVPGTHARFDTAKLELGVVPAGLRGGKEPLVALFTAVATTGAAVSPSMGRRTLPSARPVLAALNIRLGRWLPNPFSSRMRSRVAKQTSPGRFNRDARLGPGYNELLPEMLGISGTEVYVSDGGHFDNLGITALLRARCAEIWCVDSSPDPQGNAQELHRVLALVEAELGVTATIDLRVFAADASGMYGATFTTGTLAYAPGVTANLHIVKLGLTAATPQRLKDYRDEDKGFPHHKTWQQWYTRSRIESYRDLGRDSTTRGIRSLSRPDSAERTATAPPA